MSTMLLTMWALLWSTAPAAIDEASPTTETSESASKLPGAPSSASDPVLLDADPPDELEPEPGSAADDEPPPPMSPMQPVTTSFTSMSPKAARRPRTIQWRLDPFIEIGTMRVSDRGFLGFHDGPNLVKVGGGVRADARLGGRVFLGGGLSYGFSLARRGIYGYDSETGLFIHQPGVLSRLSVVILEGVDVIAQVGAGVAIARAELYTDDYGEYASQRRVAGVFDARGGVSLYLPKSWLPGRGSSRATAGIDLLLGYELRSRLAFAPKPDTEAGEIDVRGASLGDVAVRGFVWSLGVFVRVM